MSRLADFREVCAHKRAFLSTRRGNAALRQNIGLFRALLHDSGKALLILLVGDKIATAIHRRTAGHHTLHTTADLWEGICDWECARITKPAKPMNGRQTWQRYYSSLPCGDLLDIAGL